MTFYFKKHNINSHHSNCGHQMEQKCEGTPDKNADIEYK